MNALGQEIPPKADLYYFVVDRSGSISENQLKDPIQEAVSDFVGTLPADTEVNIVFFNQNASPPKIWTRLGLREKAELYNFFEMEFRPAGNTRLYDTVAEVIDRARASHEDYRVVNVIVLSDGEDNESQRYESWSSLEPIAGELFRDHESTFIAWYTLGYTPNDTPPSDGVIKHIPVPDPHTEFEIAEPKPSADFLAVPTQVKVHQEVLFALVSQTGVREVNWDFGDGRTSSNLIMKHAYEHEGSFDVSVSVSGPGGSDQLELKQHIHVRSDIPLSADFTWEPRKVRIGERVRLIDESLGQPSSWNWSISDCEPKTEQNPVVEFQTPGLKEVSLTVSDIDEESTKAQTIDVLPPLPDASFEVTPLELTAGEHVTFRAGTSESGWRHRWTIGGSVILEGPEASWVSDRCGRIEIMHRVESEGGIDIADQVIYVKEPAKPLIPVASFKASPKRGRLPLEVQFKSKSKGDIISYSWDFGDGGTSDIRDPRHTYEKPGVYHPRLIVRNTEGNESKDAGNINITVLNPLPWWVKLAMYAAIALAVWIVLIVPVILKPLLAPQKKIAVRDANTRYLKRLASKHLSNFLWPRSFITLGSSSSDDIKVGSASKRGRSAAKISRLPVSNDYALNVIASNTVDEIKKKSALGENATERQSLSKGRVKRLKDGDRFCILGTEFAWIQPKRTRKATSRTPKDRRKR